LFSSYNQSVHDADNQISNAGRDEAVIIYYFAPTEPWFFSSVIKEEKKTGVHRNTMTI